MVQEPILRSYQQNCPVRMAHSPRTVPWWNKEFSRFKTSTRRLFNQAKRTGDRESYKMALTWSNKQIRMAKWSSWRDCCLGIKDVPDRDRLMWIMASRLDTRVGSIKILDEKYTQTGKETPKELYRVHFSKYARADMTMMDRGTQTWEHLLLTRRNGNCLKGSLINLK